jgi:hypothetical protein
VIFVIKMIILIDEQYKYSALPSKIVGCGMAVHKTLGKARLTGLTGLRGSYLPSEL